MHSLRKINAFYALSAVFLASFLAFNCGIRDVQARSSCFLDHLLCVSDQLAPSSRAPESAILGSAARFTTVNPRPEAFQIMHAKHTPDRLFISLTQFSEICLGTSLWSTAWNCWFILPSGRFIFSCDYCRGLHWSVKVKEHPLSAAITTL